MEISRKRFRGMNWRNERTKEFRNSMLASTDAVWSALRTPLERQIFLYNEKSISVQMETLRHALLAYNRENMLRRGSKRTKAINIYRSVHVHIYKSKPW